MYIYIYIYIIKKYLYRVYIERDRENKEARLTVIVGEIFNTIGRLLEDLEDRNYR